MKKKLLMGIVLLLSVFVVAGCSFTKDAKTTEEFTKIASKEGLIVGDVKESQFSEYEQIKEANVASSTDGWQLEFYVLDTVDHAKSMYNKNFNTFDKQPSKKKSQMEVGNYNRFTHETDETFVLLSRVDNTFLYVEVPMSNKQAAVKIIEELGY